MVRKGDTLIEVTLAVGIFSMVAVAIVAVMSSGTSGAQTSLETTLAREEIDAEAEALRFIQSAYISDKNSDDKRFPDLWEKITKNAVELKGTDEEENLLQYAPSSCSELYNDTTGEIKNYNAFIIDYRNLGTFTNANSVYISARDNSSKFSPAQTYPRLVYTTSSNKREDQSEIIADASTFNKFYRAEGIYIIAVKDSSTTNIGGTKTAAFYDFYIRTCWYGSNANEPSTISTVIRLYDPDIVKEESGG